MNGVFSLRRKFGVSPGVNIQQNKSTTNYLAKETHIRTRLPYITEFKGAHLCRTRRTCAKFSENISGKRRGLTTLKNIRLGSSKKDNTLPSFGLFKNECAKTVDVKHIDMPASTRATRGWCLFWRASCSSRAMFIVRITWEGIVAKGLELSIVYTSRIYMWYLVEGN